MQGCLEERWQAPIHDGAASGPIPRAPAAPESARQQDGAPIPPPPSSGVRLRRTPGKPDSAPLPPAQLRQIINAYLPLVKRLVKQLGKRLPANVLEDDLISAGLAGLLDSLRRNGGDQGV